jgi:nucleoside-diphosphate-sugar epimerase
MSEKILITGSNGFLGQKLIHFLKDRHNILATSAGDCLINYQSDFNYLTLVITDKEKVFKVINQFQPDAVVDTAAMTNVDGCEDNKELCDKINVDAVQFLAETCKLAIDKLAEGDYNASGKDIMSICEMVEGMAYFYGSDASKINRISSSTLNQKTKRPPKTAFILDKTINELDYQPHSFEEGLALLEKQIN